MIVCGSAIICLQIQHSQMQMCRCILRIQFKCTQQDSVQRPHNDASSNSSHPSRSSEVASSFDEDDRLLSSGNAHIFYIHLILRTKHGQQTPIVCIVRRERRRGFDRPPAHGSNLPVWNAPRQSKPARLGYPAQAWRQPGTLSSACGRLPTRWKYSPRRPRTVDEFGFRLNAASSSALPLLPDPFADSPHQAMPTLQHFSASASMASSKAARASSHSCTRAESTPDDDESLGRRVI